MSMTKPISRRILYGLFLTSLVLLVCTNMFGQDDDDDVNLKPLLRRWLLNEKLATGVISLKTFKKATVFDGSEENVNISLLDLDHRGQKELAIQSGCAAVGNC